MLKDALTTSANAVSLGYLPRDERIHIPERYLGLFTAGENLLPDSVFSLLGELAESSIDVDKLLECAAPIPAPPKHAPPHDAPRAVVHAVRLGGARDEPFCFHYQATQAGSR